MVGDKADTITSSSVGPQVALCRHSCLCLLLPAAEGGVVESHKLFCLQTSLKTNPFVGVPELHYFPVFVRIW